MLGTILAVTMALITAPQASAETYKLATLSYPPYEYLENGEIKGIAVEILREAFRLMGHQVVISLFPMRRGLEMVKTGEVDGIFTVFRTAEREKYITYSNESILLLTITLWVRNQSEIVFDGDLENMANYKFGAVRGISYGTKFDALAHSGKLNIELTNDLNSAISMALANRFDILISNHFGAIYEMKRAGVFSDFKELSPVTQEQETYFGFSKKSSMHLLRDDLDSTLKILKQNGFYEATLKKYRDTMIYH